MVLYSMLLFTATMHSVFEKPRHCTLHGDVATCLFCAALQIAHTTRESEGLASNQGSAVFATGGSTRRTAMHLGITLACKPPKENSTAFFKQ